MLKKIKSILKKTTMFFNYHEELLRIGDNISLNIGKIDFLINQNEKLSNIVVNLEKDLLKINEREKILIENLIDRKKMVSASDLLRLRQINSLLIAVHFDKISKKHNLKCWLDGGNLIGASINNKFIPWDDDVDLLMLRKDFEKIKKIISRELNENFYICRTHTLNKTEFKHMFLKIIDRKSGASIDVVPMDFIPNSNPDYVNKFHTYGKEIVSRISDSELSFDKLNNLINQRKNELNIIDKDGKYFLPKKITDGELIHCLEFVGWYRKPIVINYKTIFPLKKIMFEKHEFYCPSETDVYLKHFYGDYTKYPEDMGIIRHSGYLNDVNYIDLESHVKKVKDLIL